MWRHGNSPVHWVHYAEYAQASGVAKETPFVWSLFGVAGQGLGLLSEKIIRGSETVYIKVQVQVQGSAPPPPPWAAQWGPCETSKSDDFCRGRLGVGARQPGWRIRPDPSWTFKLAQATFGAKHLRYPRRLWSGPNDSRSMPNNLNGIGSGRVSL